VRILISIFVSGVLCAAQETAHKRALTELNERTLKANLTFLTSEPLAGRLSLERGSDVAARWIVSEFSKAGLRGPAPGYLQPVPLIEYVVDRDQTGVTIRTPHGEHLYRAPQASVAFPKAGTVSGSIVFAGFGITAPELGYDDYAGIDVKNKIVLIFDHEPQENDAKSIFSGKGSTRYAGSFVKVRTAQEHGAVAVLLMPEPVRAHLSAEERRNKMAATSRRIGRIPSQALEESELHIPLVSLSEAVGLELLSSAKQKGADLQTAIDRDLKPVSMDLPESSASIQIALTSSRKAVGYNVVGLLEGSDPKLKEETIVISAHYDHDGQTGDGSYYPGADDNGSGTVGVVALAQAFAKSGIRPRRSILFVVFDSEERGLLGSYYYVAHPLRPLATTRAVINFDMIGRDEKPSAQTDGLITISPDTTNEMNLVGSYYSPEYTAAVERNSKKAGLKLSYKWDEEAALNVFFRSDQYPFVLRGIPAMWWFTGFHPDYHQTTDTVEKINFAKMARILEVAFRTAEEFGNAAKTPVFVPVAKPTPQVESARQSPSSLL
jgi:hypothetical protein